MNPDVPLVSVLLPARNAARFLDEALASLAAQTMTDFEVIVVDDGSTDATRERALAWTSRDPRFSVISETCGGIGAALNCALAKARGRWLARMDADDRSLPTRLAEQLELVRVHPQTDVCGTWARAFGPGVRQTWRPPFADDHIRAGLFFDAVMIHPTVVIRREALVEAAAYRPEASPAEDYDLWQRLATKHRFANVPKVLLEYRLHPAQASAQREILSARANEVRARLLNGWWPDCTEEQANFHLALCSHRLSVDAQSFADAHAWLLRLVGRSAPPLGASSGAWSGAVATFWLETCRHFRGLGIAAAAQYFRSPLRRRGAVAGRRELRLIWDILRCGRTRSCG